MWLAKICYMKLTSWSENAIHFFEREFLICCSKVMNHEAGKYAIKRNVSGRAVEMTSLDSGLDGLLL
jgi:hypothetical protein